MRTYIIIMSSLLAVTLHAQKLGPYLISTSGDAFKTEELQVYVSIGEPINTVETSASATFNQGVLHSILRSGIEGAQSCAYNKGEIFFQDCNGTLFFFIRDQNGTVYDPYYIEGLEFDEQDGMSVNFGYTTANFETPCAIAEEAILLTCIEESVISSDNDTYLNNQFTVFPNPSSGEINISTDLTNSKYQDLILYDVMGAKLKNIDLSKNQTGKILQLSFENLSDGIYILQLKTSSGTINKLITIQR